MVLILLTAMCPAWALESLDALPDALAHGSPQLDVRLRYENVRQGSIPEHAQATTVRARLGYLTHAWNGFSMMLEYQGTTAIGDDQFNSTLNGRTQYPVVADPSVSEVDQFWIAYAGLPKTVIRYGRQRLVYDDARFVGDVGFRQNLQTYDGLTVTGAWLPGLQVDYALLSNVDSFRFFPIAGVNTKNIDLHASQLFHLSYAWAPWLKTTGYLYLLNFAYDAPLPPAPGAQFNDPRRDTATYGGFLAGSHALGPLALGYHLEFARQRPYASSPAEVHADYYRAELTASVWRIQGLLGYEQLGGDGHYAFQTPLATLHAFQGWADQFLVTPANGIEDFYVSLGGRWARMDALLTWHDFNPQHVPAVHYGSEIDGQVQRPIGRRFVAGITYAHYYADHFPATTTGTIFGSTKLWAWLQFKI
ncbi:MAG: hypothetical protein IRZ06_07985 [Nevskia sp.]|nr:hypothetical protein [Nevskia sp.]